MIRITRGLDLPITGEPSESIEPARSVSRVAVLGPDYNGMKPALEVQVGDRVRRGQRLFADRKNPEVVFTAPAGGTVREINRGAKRRFLSLVIEVDPQLDEDPVAFELPRKTDLDALTREEVTGALVASGLWTALRTRPYSKTPVPGSTPHSLFVTAMDTNPLAPPPRLTLQERERDFVRGLHVLQHLTEGRVFLCTDADSAIPGTDLRFVTHSRFTGPHPAGLPGTHIHFLDPVSEHKTVWYIGYQDVCDVGRFFETGVVPVERVISLAGPSVERPRLLRTRLGACTETLTAGELKPGHHRVISGSVLSGRTATGPLAFLGRFHNQISVLREGAPRRFLGWLRPGMDMFSIKPVFASAWFARGRRFDFTTSQNGSKRAMVPIGMYEKVMPLDILPTFLLRALLVGDVEQAVALGALELDEEDLALCTFACPGKMEYGPLLRQVLERYEKEG
ncbi:MAG: Na(+)-translocating NADH-quinone reductase subunit A [Planctomycetota bacterium]|nr:MAG: Na(+)-translocating NADH-quinone reductase subunit A [Planctomycetota bacterium]